MMSASWDVWSVRVIAVLTALTGVANVLSAVTAALRDRTEVLNWPWSLRHHFHARSDRPSVQQGLQAFTPWIGTSASISTSLQR